MIEVIDQVGLMLRQRVNYLIFWVTQNCNAHCPFCFNYQENAKKNEDLDLNEIRKISFTLRDLTYLTLAGGEPTLRRDLADIVTTFAEGSRLKMCTIVTNGFRWQHMLDTARTVAERHPRLGLNVGVSIDFLGAEHDRHRGLDGCFDGCVRIIEGMAELRRDHRNVMVCANGTYTKENAKSLLETARHVMETYGIPFSVGLVRGDVFDDSLKHVSLEHYYETAREVLRLQRSCIPATTWEASIRFALEDMAVDAIYRSASENREITRCQAGRRAVVLESSGALRLCEMLPDTFGNVRDHGYDIPALLTRPESQAIIEKVWRDHCHCTWECYNRASLAFDKVRWPELLVKSVGKALAARR